MYPHPSVAAWQALLLTAAEHLEEQSNKETDNDNDE